MRVFTPPERASALETLRQTSQAMRDRYSGDCVTHACRIAALLLEEGKTPWIGRVRDIVASGRGDFHEALIPKRFAGVVWTTHYVACSGNEVYDPIAGEPVGIGEYALEVFGRRLTVETHFDPATTERLLRNGTLRQQFGVRRR